MSETEFPSEQGESRRRIEVEVEGEQVERIERRGGGLGGVINLLLVLPALGFIGFGVAIVVWPKLLNYVVAGIFVLIGIGLLVAARKVGRVRKQAAAFKARFTGAGWGPPADEP